MERMWRDGDPVDTIAEAIGCSAQTVYNHSSRERWKRGKKEAEASAPTAYTGPSKPTPRRRCDHCTQVTNQTPCQHCGKPWLSPDA
jgi:hypothetical protein